MEPLPVPMLAEWPCPSCACIKELDDFPGQSPTCCMILLLFRRWDKGKEKEKSFQNTRNGWLLLLVLAVAVQRDSPNPDQRLLASDYPVSESLQSHG